MNWSEVVEKTSPYMVKIYTSKGYGTGFLCVYGGNKMVCGIATALHVVEHAAEWQEPIKLQHHESGIVKLVKEEDRIILSNPETDSAIILLEDGFHFPAEPIPMLPQGMILKAGEEVCWVGFPNLEPDDLCFFSGRISFSKKTSYFIDGVAIHGVSGGPVLFPSKDGLKIVGIVSAYFSDISPKGVASPGLLYAQDVSYFYEVVNKTETIKDAELKKKEIESNTSIKKKKNEP